MRERVHSRANGPLRVDDLLRSPALQLRLLCGAGGLDRAVSWAHVSELEDPTPWLLGAEVIMSTGMAIPRSATGQREYLERLDDAGVAALALSEGLHVPPLRRAFFDTAQERDMPVLEVPLPVPFVTVVQEVAAALQADVRQRLGAQLRVFGALRWMTAEELAPDQVFARLEQLSGYQLFACTPQRQPLLPGVSAPPDSITLPASGSAPPSIPGGFALPVPAPGGPAGYLIALERSGAAPADLAVVQHIATVAALHVTMARHVRETLRRERAETLAELLRGVVDAATARRRLERHGFDLGVPVLLAAIRTPAGQRVDDEIVVRALDEASIEHLLLGQELGHYVLGPDDSALRAALASIDGGACGLSQPFAAGDPLDVPRREALWAVERAIDVGAPLVAYEDGAPAERWLPGDAGSLRALVTHVLGPALDYDAQRDGSELIRTVRTWLERDRRSEETARALHVHPNTLAYRLRRFGELTHRDLSTTADIAEVWLALTALRHLAP
ncbi:MAG: PucR family transcriptional regulator [Streptosporangiaceae bacterium]